MHGWDYHTNRAYYAAHAAEDRDRAVIARIGGNEYRRRLDRIGRGHGYRTLADCDAAVIAAVGQVQRDRKSSRKAQLPEAAFDWPIYRAGIVARLMSGGALAALAELFPDALTRPLYTIEDMERHRNG